MNITIDSIFELEDDFQDIFLSKSGIHVRPQFKELRLATRSIGDTKYNDLYIIQPDKYYRIDFKEDMSSYNEDDTLHYLKSQDVFYDCGILTFWQPRNARLYIYNASSNIVYIQKGMKIGELVE